ncbi:translocation/assembly module TamB domain-containing protein [Craurococcus roseus]|uniref:Translocation/assembly module TamB domain-containing protein n=1 Tax=Craurococcus roseus TaxID=77585 RepID=A0ABN1FBL6_9PROT
MRRVLRWALILVFLAVALPVAALVGALVWANTEAGQARLAALASAQVPGLAIEGLHGPLPSVAGAARITMADADGVWLTVDGARLALDYSALLRREFRIEAVEADRIEIVRPPLPGPETPPEPRQPSEGVLPRLPELPVAVSLDRLEVRRLEIGEPVVGTPSAFAVTTNARLGDGALRAALDAKRLDAEGRASIDLRLSPAEDSLHAKATVREGPDGVVPTLLKQPGKPFELDLSLEGPASGAALDLAAGLGPDLALKLGGTVRAAPDGAAGADLDGTARVAALLPPDIAPLAGGAEFSLRADLGADRRVALHRLDLRVPAATVSATGRADLSAETVDAQVALNVAEAERLRPLVPETVRWAGIAAKARIGGTFSEPSIELDVVPEALGTGVPQTDALLGPSPRLALRAALPGPRFDAKLDGAASNFSAKGNLSGETIALDASVSVPDLAVLGAGSEGALEADLHAEGPLNNPDLTLQARSGRIEAAGRVLERLVLDATVKQPASAPTVDARASGEIENLPISLAVRGRPQGQALRLEEGTAQLGRARLEAAGLLDTTGPAGPVFEGTARLEASDLAPLTRLAGQAGVAGRLALEATLDRAPSGEQAFDVRLDAPRLVYAGTEGTLRATAKGTPSDLAWTIQGRAPDGSVSGRGTFASIDGGRRLDLESLEAQGLGETLRLVSPAQVALGADGGIRLSGLALALGRGGRLQAAGRWGPERADLTATVNALPLSFVGRFAPDVRPEGTLSAEVRATGPVSEPEIRGTVQATGLKAGADWAKGLPVASLRGEGRLVGESAQLRAELEAGAAGRLVATARLPRGFGPSAPLEASLDGNLNLAPLAAPFLAAGADRLTGRLAVALRAGGTVGAPELAGRATLSDGDYRNTLYGVRISNLNGTVVGDGSRLVIERLEGRTAGNGTISVAGSVDVGAAGFPADIRITARDARPVVSELVTATLGADLRLTRPITGGGLLSGEVRIQNAEIRIPSQLPASVPTLTNVREVGRPPNGRPRRRPEPAAAPASSGPPLNLDVRVLAPRSVFIRGRGVDVELGGDVTVGGTVAEPVPRGGLTLRRGTLSLLARRLDFRRGTINFAAGTLIPQLDLEARSVSGQNTISVFIRGTPTSPEVTFSSVPELPQDEVLAQLLFGKATSGLSPLELAQIGAAVAQLTGVGGSGGGPLDRVRSALGLDRLGVGGGNGSTASPTVEAGRYVAPGVFLGVRQGTQGQTGVGVQVEITPRLKLEGETATGPAGDRLGFSYELEY